MYSISPLLLVLVISGVYSEQPSPDKNANDNANTLSVRLPSINDINRGEKMTITVPILKTPPLQFVRQIGLPTPPQKEQATTTLATNSNNNPTALYYYELYKHFSPQIQHLSLPSIVYSPPEIATNSFHNNEQINMNAIQQALYQHQQQQQQYNQQLNSPKMLLVNEPPGLPIKTLAKLDKLINTINKSLVSVCQNDKSESSSTSTNKNCPPSEQKPSDEYQNRRYEKWLERNMIIKNKINGEKEQNERIVALENEQLIPNIDGDSDCSFDPNCQPSDLDVDYK